MKLIIITFLVISSVFINSKSKNRKNHKKGIELPVRNAHLESVTYGYASNDEHVLQNLAGLRSAELMEKIPIHLNKPYTGIVAEPNTVNYF
jgi:hypothetical protein